MNSGKLFREQMIENFKSIEQNDNDVRQTIKKEHDDLSHKIDGINERLDKLFNGGGM